MQHTLLAAVFLDMMGVALVVPNLTFFWKEAGITPAGLGLVSAVYSSSQLIGGLIIGWLGDRVFSRKSCLLLSFAGSSASYLLVGISSSIEALIMSRVLVGLVKQTMTCTMALTARFSDEATRAQSIGRISSATTLAFICGQALGGALSMTYGRRALCYIASSLFVVAFMLVLLCLPRTNPEPESTGTESMPSSEGREMQSPPSTHSCRLRVRLRSFAATFTEAFRSHAAQRVLVLRISYTFLMRATYTSHGLYEQERWSLTPSNAGFLSTYKTALALAMDSVLVGMLSRRLSDRAMLRAALLCSAANAALEACHSTFRVYALVNIPLSSVLGTLVKTTLSTIFSKVVPASDAGSALSVLDLCNSIIGMTAPIYGGVLLGRIGVLRQPVISLVHYATLLGLATALTGKSTARPSGTADKPKVT